MTMLLELSTADEVSCDEVDTTDHAEPFAPSRDDDAARLGFELTIAGEHPAPPRGWDFGRLLAFYDGVYSAWVRQAREEREAIERDMDYEDWLDSLPDFEPESFAEYDAYHDSEIVEAVGVIEARKGGAR
jgi:hypothetical protein